MPWNPDSQSSEATPDWNRWNGHQLELARWGLCLFRDQIERWHLGHRRPVESYLIDHPSLVSCPAIGALLAASEFVIRADRGEAPKLDEYVRRFPQWSHRIAQDIAFLRQSAAATAPMRDPNVPESSIVRTPSQPVCDGAWPRLPGYELHSELGRGGMAIVYQARHLALNRPVALKVILAGALAGTKERVRMRREAEVVAGLKHPNIVQIYDIDEHHGCLYLALEYIDGGSLDGKIAGRPLPPDEAAWLVEQLAGALQATHNAGIVHRDLKPANVLLSQDGTPKVTDFGLAKREDESRRLTATGAAAGTPSYMSPEQVMSEADKIGPATDVYGLGAILYECLTGRPPFDAPKTLETMRQVVNEEVVPVRQLQASVPSDLETICLKCLQKEIRKRYLSAQDLAEDLARFRTGQPILARPVGVIERVWRWGYRHPTVPLLVLTLGLLVVSVAGLMGWTIYHTYQVAGHLREYEMHLHNLRGSLLHLGEAQARYVDLAATTGEIRWEADYRHTVDQAMDYRADATRLAPDAVAIAELLPAAEAILIREQEALRLVRAGKPADAWQFLQTDEHTRHREAYQVAVSRFAEQVDRVAYDELRQIRSESFWSLASGIVVSGLIIATVLATWLISVKRVRH